jgi:hypothetical protein
MKHKKKNLRRQHIWFSVWNTQIQSSPKCDAVYKPTRISGK